MKSALLPSLLCLASLAPAQTSAPSSPAPVTKPAPKSATKVYPLQAELAGSLAVTKAKVGDRVLVKLTREWVDADACTLPRGSALVGHITSIDLWSRTSKRSSLSLLFDAACGDGDPQPLTWIAVLAPDDSDLAGLHSANPVAVQAFRSGTFGESGGIGSAGNENGSRTDLSGRQNPNFPVSLGPAPDRSHPRPTAVSTGQVWGLQDLSLGVAAGPLGSSVLSSKKKDVHLPAGSVLVLSPRRAQPVEVAAAPAATFTPHRAPAPEEPLLTSTDLCPPTTCSVASRLGATTPDAASLLQTVPLAGLGYHPLKAAEMLSFEFGAALAYLGPDHLLFTFNPHTLVPRDVADDPASHPHMVRAVLLNLRTSAVEGTADWRVGDDRQYLWPIAPDRILVHAGDRLLLLSPDPQRPDPQRPDPQRPDPQPTSPQAEAPGSQSQASQLPGLHEIGSVPLPSHLAFARGAPDGRHIAVGLLHELHTHDVHAALAAETVNGPEEEVSVLLFDDSLKPLGKTRQSSFALPPVLSESGPITLLHAGGERWRYQETTWSGQPRTLARLSSSCIPELSALSSRLFYVLGCDTRNTGRWYRVLRSDGSTALKGSLLTRDMQRIPLAEPSGQTFALALPSAREGYLPDSPFHGADITSEVVRVFRSSDGHGLFAARMHAPAPTRQPIAFAPDSTHLAILDGEQITIYALHPEITQPIAANPNRGATSF